MTGVLRFEPAFLIRAIQTGERLRPAEPDAVAALARSMAAEGLLQPIGLTIAGTAGGVAPATLVWGLHRLEAARQLGWDAIPAQVLAGPEVRPREIEAVENLCRADLAPYDRAVAVSALRDAMKAAAKRERSAGGFEESANFADPATVAALAERMGVSKRAVEYDLRLVDRLLMPETAAAMRGREGWMTASLVQACAGLDPAVLVAWLAGNPAAGLREAVQALASRSTAETDPQTRLTAAFLRLKESARVDTVRAMLEVLTPAQRSEVLAGLSGEADR